jgi:hypothetical protein
MESTMERGETKPSLECKIEQIPELVSTQTQSDPSPTKMEGISVTNGDYESESDNDIPESDDDASESESDESENEIHFRGRGFVYLLKFGIWWLTHNFPFLFCWGVGAVILVLPLVLSATKFRTAYIKNVRLFGFFFWLTISWCALLFSYLFSWVLGYIWFVICQHNWPISDDYETFVVDIRHSTTLFLWAIISWALVPLLCVIDHHHCTDYWVSTLHKVLLVTFLLALGFLAKSIFVERIFIKTAMDTMNQRQRELENRFYAIVVLLPISGRYNSIFEWVESIIEWVKAMRTWSTPNPTAENRLRTYLQPQSTAPYIADIFQGNGSRKAYTKLRLAIENSPDFQGWASTSRNGLYKAQVDHYLSERLQQKEGHWHIWNDDFSLALRRFKKPEGKPDRLWPILQDSKFDQEDQPDFVSFKDLDWLIVYLGESLKEAVQGQKNIKSVVKSLDIRLTLFLCIPAAIVYCMCFSSYYEVPFLSSQLPLY